MLHYDGYWQSLIGLLAAYARYARVGRHTAMGLGQAQQIDLSVGSARFSEDYTSARPHGFV